MFAQKLIALLLGTVPPVGNAIARIMFTHGKDPLGGRVHGRILTRLRSEHRAVTAALLLLLFPDALKIMEWIEGHILPSEGSAEVESFKKAFSSDFSMYALAVCGISFTCLLRPVKHGEPAMST